MKAPHAMSVGGKKFFWDGAVYSTREDAAKARATYERDGFETCSTSESDQAFVVYTRRVVRQAGEAKAN